jgi:hypothetical protein
VEHGTGCVAATLGEEQIHLRENSSEVTFSASKLTSCANDRGWMSNRHFFSGSPGPPAALLLAASLLAINSIPASAQAASPASGVASRSGDNVLTAQDMDDLRVIDACVLDTPLSPVEQEQAQQNIVRQFQSAPAAFTKTEPANRQIADLLRHGLRAERTELAMSLWAAWNSRAQVDPTVKWWTDLVRRHNPAIAQSGDLVVTRLQLNGLFADNDWVAKTAGLPVSTEASRAAFIRELSAKFAACRRQTK